MASSRSAVVSGSRVRGRRGRRVRRGGSGRAGGSRRGPGTRRPWSRRSCRPRRNAGDREAGPVGEVALQGDGEPAPQLGGVPLPDHMGGVVVAVGAQRLAEPRVVVAVALGAPQRPAVRADRLVPPRPAGALLPDPVHGPERRRGQGGERARDGRPPRPGCPCRRPGRS